MRRTAALVAIALTVLLPASGAGAKTVSPPGNSGLSQYLEVVPSAGGAQPVKGLRHHRSPLTRRQQRALGSAGRDGRALQALVSATSPAGAVAVTAAGTPAPVHVRGRGAAARRAKARERARRAKAERRARQAALAYAGGGGGDGGSTSGIGAPLIVLMAIAAAGVGGAALARRHGGRADDGPDAEPQR